MKHLRDRSAVRGQFKVHVAGKNGSHEMEKEMLLDGTWDFHEFGYYQNFDYNQSRRVLRRVKVVMSNRWNEQFLSEIVGLVVRATKISDLNQVIDNELATSVSPTVRQCPTLMAAKFRLSLESNTGPFDEYQTDTISKMFLENFTSLNSLIFDNFSVSSTGIQTVWKLERTPLEGPKSWCLGIESKKLKG